jgi:PRC-barrel domain
MPLSAAKLVDRYGESVGTVAGFWLDPSTHRVAFLGVKTGWLPGRVHILPAGDVEIEEHGSLIAPGYTAALIKKAPTGHPGAELAEADSNYPRTSLLFMRTHALPPPVKRAGETPILPSALADEGGKPVNCTRRP